MVKHVVCWRLKSNFSSAEKEEKLKKMQEALKALKNKIPFIVTLEVGINIPEVSTENYDIVLIVEVNSIDELNSYQQHPEHLKVKSLVQELTQSRACVDFYF